MTDASAVHVSLNTTRFEAAVAFYRTFLGVEPVKLKPGYAKFELEKPSLNLALNAVAEAPRGGLSHLGIEVASTAEVRAAVARLEAAGLTTRVEENTDCCYALQDKVWVNDPDGNAWEVFVVKVPDTRPDLGPAAAATLSCCAPSCCTPEAAPAQASGSGSCC